MITLTGGSDIAPCYACNCAPVAAKKMSRSDRNAKVCVQLVVRIAISVCLAWSVACHAPARAPTLPQHALSAAAAQVPRTTSPLVTDLHTVEIRVVGTDALGDVVMETTSDLELFRAGHREWAKGQLHAALLAWRTLLAQFPTSELAPEASWNIAAALEADGLAEEAIAELTQLADRYPTSDMAVRALVMAAALRADEANWFASRDLLVRAAQDPNLSYGQRIEVAARRGLAELRLGRLGDALSLFDAAIADAKRAPPLDDNYFLAMAHYQRGMVFLARIDVTPVVADTASNMAKALDQKERLAANAYDAFVAALPYREPYWALAAGYQMSAVYERLYKLFAQAPPPTDLRPGGEAALQEELATRLRRYLDVAQQGHEANVKLAAAYGVDNEWSQKSRQAAAQLAIGLADSSVPR